MGVALTELLLIKEIDLEFLKNKSLVVDAPMWLYQFLSSIRQRDGSLLTDSNGNVTSHLMGLMSRISNLSQQGIKLEILDINPIRCDVTLPFESVNKDP